MEAKTKELLAARLGLKKSSFYKNLHLAGHVVQEAKVPLNEYEFPQSKLANVQSQLEKLVEKNFYLHTSARDAYRSYLLAYNSHQLKEIFNVHTLDLLSVAKSFGFAQPPRVGMLPQYRPGWPVEYTCVLVCLHEDAHWIRMLDKEACHFAGCKGTR